MNVNEILKHVDHTLLLQVNTCFCRSHSRKDTVFSYNLWIDL